MEFEDGARSKSVRFALLLHLLPKDSPRSTHWDLMLQQSDALLTFALQSLPPQTAKPEITAWPATRLADHRVRYLDYEGVVGPAYPGGPDRGSVRRVAAGWAVCDVIRPAAAGDAVAGDTVAGDTVSGNAAEGVAEDTVGDAAEDAAAAGTTIHNAAIQHTAARCRWTLDSPTLRAVFTYLPCQVGQTTQLHIESWQAAW